MAFWPFGPSLQTQINALNKKVAKLASQADVDALTARLAALDTRTSAAVTAIKAEITALQNANPNLNLAGLTAAVGQLETDESSVEGLEVPDSPAPDSPPSS